MANDNPHGIPIFDLALIEANRTCGPGQIATTADAVTLVYPYLQGHEHVCLLLVLLDAAGYCLGVYDKHLDALHGTAPPTTDLMRVALLRASTRTLILAHTHANGAVTPHETDLTLTHDFAILAQIFGFTLRDHLILGSTPDTVFSFRRAGWLGEPL